MRLLLSCTFCALVPTFAFAQIDGLPTSVQNLQSDQNWASGEAVVALYEPYLLCVKDGLDAVATENPLVQDYNDPRIEGVFEVCGIANLPTTIRDFAHDPEQGLSEEVAERRTITLLAMIQIWSFGTLRQFFTLPEDSREHPAFRIEDIRPIPRPDATEDLYDHP